MTDRAPSLGDDATKIRGAAAPGLQLPHSECQATLLPLFDLSTAHISFLRQLTLLSFLAHRDIVYRLSLSPLTCKVAASSAAASLARTLERLLNKGAALSISPARAAKKSRPSCRQTTPHSVISHHLCDPHRSTRWNTRTTNAATTVCLNSSRATVLFADTDA